MDAPAKTIAVVRDASGPEIQALFQSLAEQWQREMRLAGLVAEDHGLPDRFCSAGYLRSLATGMRFSIFHDLGPGVAACQLDGVGAVSAADAVQHDIAAGCDLVMLSKFGKLEAAGEGLAGAFHAAVTAGLPLLTSVPPAHDDAWRQFAQRDFAVLPADAAAIDKWRQTVRAGGRGDLVPRIN